MIYLAMWTMPMGELYDLIGDLHPDQHHLIAAAEDIEIIRFGRGETQTYGDDSDTIAAELAMQD